MSPLGDGELETAAAMAAALRADEVSAIELVDRALRRAERWQPSINAFSQPWPEEALAAAERAGDGAFAGVPIAVKDLFDMAGHESTGCCAAYRGRVAVADAEVVTRLHRAGPVTIGKTNQHELAAGGTNLVSACGRTGNPWDPSRMTGGSSGGSGAAVAAGIVPWALGSDTGGSIRIPSALCGTFGLKPTTGRLPLDGVMPLAPSMDCPGPMAATLTDLLALYAVLVGAEASVDPGAEREAALAPMSRPLRVGVPDGFFRDRVHDEVLAAVREVAGALEGAGAEIEAVDGSGLENVRRVWMHVCTAEFADAYPDLRGERLDLVAPQVRSWLEQGTRMSQDERRLAARDRDGVSRWYRDRLEGFDALLIPTTPYPAPGAEDATVDLGAAGTVEVAEVGPGWITCSVNLAGLPALNLPAARSHQGLPIGISLVGHEDQEAVLFRLAARWEAATGYLPRLPEATPPTSSPASSG
jgi:aspartyl-tRNA(Asn)/glutamyl-tRNA(Gln) amidotransferase subunit A